MAGGSSGIVAIARELGGDDRVVAAVQYFRVALITAAMPFVVTVFFHDAVEGLRMRRIGRRRCQQYGKNCGQMAYLDIA